MRALPLLLLLALAGPAAANVPAAYIACDGIDEGGNCSLPGPRYGVCVRDTLCADDAATDEDDCLLCVDPCWGTDEAGGYCVQITGEDGVCQPQDRCTDKPETSFRECNRCVDGEVPRTEPDEGGCAAIDAAATLPWLAILLALGLQLRRRRAAGPRSAAGPTPR